jgi:beta-glucosidase-like glycosyl hydrolase
MINLSSFFLIAYLLQNLVIPGQLDTEKILDNHFDYKTKLGQMLMVNIWPHTDRKIIISLIRDYKVGNFNLIGQYKTKKEVKELINFINEEAKKYLPLPPFIAIDEEGYISRLPFLKSIPQNKLKTINNAYNEALNRGRELKKLGFNMIFSPVLDFTTNKNDYIWPRTFQQDKNKTIVLGKAMIKGYKKAKIISIPKHLPGYVNDKNDPHGTLLISKNLNDYQDNFEIFKEVLNDDVLGVMMAHLVIKEFGDKPITRSKNFIEYLGQNLNYKGLLVTDSLGMRAFRLSDSFEKATLDSLLAGYDLLILSSNQNVSLKVIKFLNENLDDENVRKKIDKSFLKIYRIKKLKLL